MATGGPKSARAVWQQSPDGRISHRFEPIMFVLALLVVPVVLIEDSHASHRVKVAAAAVNWFIWIGFTIELLFIVWLLRAEALLSGRTGLKSASCF
jgi:hypothetical protein